MKYFLSFLLAMLFHFYIFSQNLIGAWETGDKETSVLTFTKAYYVFTTYNSESGAFISTQGGSWSLEGLQLKQEIEFNSKAAEKVGTTAQWEIKIFEDSLYIPALNKGFKRIDNGGPGALAGSWLMSGRTVKGEFTSREGNNPRKTMKILSGTRFQWIAYNTEKKEFIATGGRTYTTENGEYTEEIIFFSKDSSRVGMNLKFKYELTPENDWKHLGFSTQGDPIDETWSIRP